MKTLLRAALFALFAVACAYGRGRASGYCQQGGQTIQVLGYVSSAATPVQASYTGSGCNVLVLYSNGANGANGPYGSVTTNGTAVAYASGNVFNANGQWSGLSITINNVVYTIASCASSLACTLTSSAGTQANPVIYSMSAATPAAIFSDNNGTVKSNPFAVSGTGYWFYYADNGTYANQYSGTAIASTFTNAGLAAIDPATLAGQVTPQLYGARCDGVTDDSTAINSALAAASISGTVLTFNSLCAVSSVQITTSGPVSVVCADPQTTGLVRTTASLQAGTPLLKVTNASDVTLRGCGWFEKGDGTNYTNAASDVWLATVGTVSIENNYCTLAQSNCFLIAGANDVKFIGNTCDHVWYACVAVSGTGTVGSKTYVSRFTATGNTCSHMPYCILASVFVNDVAITGNTALKATYALVQDVNHSTVNDNVEDGAPDYGLSTGATADCIFLEGISQFTIASNHLYNCGGRGIFAEGSSLTVGTTEQLAMLEGNIVGNQIDSVASQSSIYVRGASQDGSITGSDISVKDNTITNGLLGITVTSSKHVDISGNHDDNLLVGGDVIAGVTDFRYAGNRLHNVGVAVVGTYPGVLTNTSLNGYAGQNVITNDGGNSLTFCWSDTTLAGGTATVIQIAPDNAFTGCTPLNPAVTAPPTLGIWPAGAVSATFTTTTGAPLYFLSTAAGSPGTWKQGPFLGNPGTPAVSSCGSGAAVIGGDNNSVVIEIGSGTVTACTITYSQAFSGAPSLVGWGVSGAAYPYFPTMTGPGTTSTTVDFSTNVAGQFFWMTVR